MCTSGVSNLADFLFPFQCISCNIFLERNHFLCTTCITRIPIERGLYCPLCMKRRTTLTTCHESPLTAIGFATSYEVPLIRDLIHIYKYDNVRSCVYDLGLIIDSYLEQSQFFFDLFSHHGSPLIVPIPLHPLRERVRGFNQATLLGKYIAQHYTIPFSNALIRISNNPPQAQMKSKDARRKNAEHLFKITEEVRNSLQRKTILLIDDVATSQATLISAAHELKRNGAKTVIGLVIAKG